MKFAILAGDGIGPEIVEPAAKIAQAALLQKGISDVEWESLPMGQAAIETHGQAMPVETLTALEQVNGWLLGPHDSVAYPEPHHLQLNPSGMLRKHFDLFANIRPAKSVAGIRAMATDIDLVIVRENTEGFYADRNTHTGTGEFMPSSDMAISMCVITRRAVERVARVAFQLARTRSKHVTIVHKANVLKLTTGLFKDVCMEIGRREFQDVEVDDFHIDAMMAHILRRPAEFDVIVTENMFGDILSDMTGELSGSLGMAASLNASDNRAMAQAAHGAAPDIAGKGVANPIAMILSTAMLLDWIGKKHRLHAFHDAASVINKGVYSALTAGIATRDLGGNASTQKFCEAILHELTQD